MGKKNVLAMILAGGEGKRLMPLTLDRAKPAVPFGGTYRLIDFALSNVVNSGYLRSVVLTPYESRLRPDYWGGQYLSHGLFTNGR